MQKSMFEEAKKRMLSRIHDCETVEEARDYFETTQDLGFVRMDVSVLDDPAFEQLKSDFSLTPRCMPKADEGKKVLIGKSY